MLVVLPVLALLSWPSWSSGPFMWILDAKILITCKKYFARRMMGNHNVCHEEELYGNNRV